MNSSTFQLQYRLCSPSVFLVLYRDTAPKDVLSGLARELQQISHCEKNVVQTIQFHLICFPDIRFADLPTLFDSFDTSIHWDGFHHLQHVGVEVCTLNPGIFHRHSLEENQHAAYSRDIETAIRNKLTGVRSQVAVKILVTF